MFKEIRNELKEKSEKSLAEFTKNLCPNNKEEILGIRIPILRKMAKEILKKEWKSYLKEIEETKQEQYMEEIVLEGLVIGYSKIDIEEKLELIKKFIPKINNWLINDTFCSTLKVKEADTKKIWDFLQPYLKSDKEFEIRFAVIMMLGNFLIDEYVDKVILELDKIHNDGYYAKMGVAWTLAEIGVKYNEKAMKYLKGKNNLDDFTYNKTLQKMRESYRISKEQKDELKKMKRK